MANRFTTRRKFIAVRTKSGTTHFHAYATAAVVHKGHRYTLALTRVEYGEKMKPIVQRLLAIIRRRKVKVRFLLLDKGFFSVEVISYLKRIRLGFIIPAMARGRKPTGRKKATGLRAVRQKKERLLPPHAHGQDPGKATQHTRDDLRGEQKLQTQEDRQAAHQEVDVRDLENPPDTARDSRDVSYPFRHRNQLSANERSTNQNLYPRSTIAIVVRGHRPGAAECLGVAALQTRQRKMG